MKLPRHARIDALELSVRGYNLLNDADIRTVGELAEYSLGDLRHLPVHFPTDEIRWLKDELKRHGWSFSSSHNPEGSFRWTDEIDLPDWKIILRAHWSFRKRVLLEALRDNGNKVLTYDFVRTLPRLANFAVNDFQQGSYPFNTNFRQRKLPYRLLKNRTRSGIQMYKRVAMPALDGVY